MSEHWDARIVVTTNVQLFEAALLRLIDRFLARRDEERAAKLLNFDELPVLYDEADFPVVLDKALGWSGNSTPEALTIENPLWYDYA